MVTYLHHAAEYETFNFVTLQLSFHKFNEREREPSILRRLHEGEAVALISDAGTPGISDPGMELVSQLTEFKLDVVSQLTELIIRVSLFSILISFEEANNCNLIVISPWNKSFQLINNTVFFPFFLHRNFLLLKSNPAPKFMRL